MKQIVKIKTEIGTITLSSESKFSQNNTNQIDNVSLINVPIMYNHTQTIPIIYNKTNEFANICILEEFKYEISFETEQENLDVFKTLKNFPDNSPLDIYPFDNNYKGSLQFSSYVGKTFLDIYKNGECIFKLPIEVQSRKLNYSKHYPQMIGDLSKYASGIVFELNSPVYQEFIIGNDNQSPYEKFMLLEYILREEHLPSIIEYLSRNLFSTLENVKEEVPISFASNINPNDLIDAILDCEELHNNIPSRVNETKYEDTIDVAENRFYKYFLELISDLIDNLLKEIPDGYAHDKLMTYKKELNYYLSQKYFKEISRLNHIPLNSQVLQKKEGYRDILSYYLMFEFGFKLKWKDLSEKFKGHEKKLYELYEYWCYFKLIEMLESICGMKINFEDIFAISDDGMSIELKEGIIKNFNYEGTEIDLLYNKTFNRFGDNYKTYSVNLRPDYTLAIHLTNETYYIHFDAKYKMYVDTQDFKNEDIVKMHAYKDAIKNSIGAYVLYPGSNYKIYYENDDNIKSVGAIGLTPGENFNEKKLCNLIIDLLDSTKHKLCLNNTSIKNTAMSEIIPFESEFILHSLTQKHLKELFDLECVASEIQLNNLRLDNLAFDKKTNSFVIIEYKNEFNANVLHQAQDYYDLILNNKDFFLERLNNGENVDFTKTRVMIVGPEFSEDQIKQAEAYFELWKVTLFDDCKVTYENLKTHEVKSLEANPDDLKLTEDLLLKDKPQKICEPYLALKEKLTADFNDLESRVLVDAVSFRANGKLICKVDLKSSVKIYFYSKNIKDSENRLRNISDITTGDLADWELKINSNGDIDYACEIFRQAYENINNQKIR